MGKKNHYASPFLPVDVKQAYSIPVAPKDNVVLESKLYGKDDTPYWVVLYHADPAPTEILRIFVNSPQRAVYWSDRAATLLVTHWKVVKGKAQQQNVIVKSK